MFSQSPDVGEGTTAAGQVQDQEHAEPACFPTESKTEADASAEPEPMESVPAAPPLSDVLESAWDAIVLQDATGRITFWNAAAAADWEWNAQEAVGQSFADLIIVDQSHYAEVTTAIAQAGQWRGHLATVNKSGRLLIRHASVSAWDCGEDVAPGLLISCRAAETLAGDARSVLRLERLEALAQSVASRAHDLNNALSPLTISMDMIRDRLPGAADQNLVETMQLAVDWAVVLVQELVDAAQAATAPLQLPESDEPPAITRPIPAPDPLQSTLPL
jgi:PAS domain S-box-containing protein